MPEPIGEIQLMGVNRGVTIGPGDLSRLFDQFYRADSARSDVDRNQGLNMSIVAATARIYGGRPLASSSGGTTSIGIRLKRTEPDTGPLVIAAP